MIYVENGVTFSNVVYPGIITSGPMISKGKYKVNSDDTIKASMPVINAIDINWDGAQTENIDIPINTTSQLINLIANSIGTCNEINNKLNNLSNVDFDDINDKLNIILNINFDEIISKIQQIENNESYFNAIDGINSRIDNIQSSYNEQLDRIQQILTNVNNRLDNIDTGISNNNTSISVLSNTVNGLRASISSMQNSISSNSNNISNINTKINDLENGLTGINSTVSSLNNALDGVEENITNIENTINGINESLNELDENITTVNNNTNARIDSIMDILDPPYDEHIITYNLTNVVKVNCPDSYPKNSSITLTVRPHTGYLMPNDIIVENAEYVYDKQNNTITLSNATSQNVSITINASDKIQYSFNIPTLEHLTCELITQQNTFGIGDRFDIRIQSEDNNTYQLPDTISTTRCRLISYNKTNGNATLECLGTGDMTISASPIINKYYYFAVLSEQNPMFTLENNTVSAVDMTQIENVVGYLKANNECPIDYVNGYDVDPSLRANFEDYPTYVITPLDYFNENTFVFTDGTDNYKMYKGPSFFGNLVESSDKTPIYTTYNGINYIIWCLNGEEGVEGLIEFKKI